MYLMYREGTEKEGVNDYLDFWKQPVRVGNHLGQSLTLPVKPLFLCIQTSGSSSRKGSRVHTKLRSMPSSCD